MSGKQWLKRWNINGCGCMAITLPLIEADFIKAGIIHELIDWFQGAYHRGTAASAGTHDAGGVGDTNLWSAKAQEIWKKWGVIPFHRVPPLFDEHCHVAWYGCPHGAPLLKDQVSGAVHHGWNGLAGRSSRTGEWGRVPKHTWQEAVKLYKPKPPPPKPPAPKGILSMASTLFYGTSKGQTLPVGKSTHLWINDKRDTSVVIGQNSLEVTVCTVQASKLSPATVVSNQVRGGEIVHLYWQLVYAGKGKADIVRANRKVSLTLDALHPRGQLTWIGGIPKSDKAGYDVRLRIAASTNAKAAHIDWVTVEGAKA